MIIKPNGTIQQNHISYNPRYELPIENKSYYLNTEQLGKHVTYNTNNLYYSNTVNISNTTTKNFIFPHIPINSNNVEDAFTEIKDKTSVTGRNLYQCRDDNDNPLLSDSSNQKVIDIIWNPCKQCYVALVLKWTVSNNIYTYTSVILQSEDGISWTKYHTFLDIAFYAMEYWANKIYLLGAVKTSSTNADLTLYSITAFMSNEIAFNDEINFCSLNQSNTEDINLVLRFCQAGLSTDGNDLCFVIHPGVLYSGAYVAYYGLGRLLYSSTPPSIEYKVYNTTLPMDFTGELGGINLINIGAGKYIITNVDNSNTSAYVYYTPETSYNSDTLTPVVLRNNVNYTMFIKNMFSINQCSKLSHVLMAGTASNRNNYTVNIANNSTNIFALKTWQEPVYTTLNSLQAINSGGSSYLFNTNELNNQLYCTSSFPYQSGMASLISRGVDDNDLSTYRDVKFYSYDVDTQSYLYSSSLKAEKNWQILDKIFVYARNNDMPGLYYSDIKM